MIKCNECEATWFREEHNGLCPGCGSYDYTILEPIKTTHHEAYVNRCLEEDSP